MELNELIQWHSHMAAECRQEDESEEKIFHLEAVDLLAKIKIEKESE